MLKEDYQKGDLVKVANFFTASERTAAGLADIEYDLCIYIRQGRFVNIHYLYNIRKKKFLDYLSKSIKKK